VGQPPVLRSLSVSGLLSSQHPLPLFIFFWVRSLNSGVIEYLQVKGPVFTLISAVLLELNIASSSALEWSSAIHGPMAVARCIENHSGHFPKS
jgi:hypothetical protein